MRENKLSPDEAVHDLTLALLYLNCFTDSRQKGEEVLPRAWKSYDWDALDKLSEEEYIIDRHGNKSLYLTESGMQKAREILNTLNISDWNRK